MDPGVNRLEKKVKKNKSHRIRNLVKSSGFIPIILFIVLCAVFAVSSYYSSPSPVIESISPEIGYPGDVLEIQGRHFGNPEARHSRNIVLKPSGSAVYMAKNRLVLSDFIYWSDEKIRVKIPAETESGQMWIETKNGTSNSVIFTNRKEIPQILSGPVDPDSLIFQE